MNPSGFVLLPDDVPHVIQEIRYRPIACGDKVRLRRTRLFRRWQHEEFL